MKHFVSFLLLALVFQLGQSNVVKEQPLDAIPCYKAAERKALRCINDIKDKVFSVNYDVFGTYECDAYTQGIEECFSSFDGCLNQEQLQKRIYLQTLIEYGDRTTRVLPHCTKAKGIFEDAKAKHIDASTSKCSSLETHNSLAGFYTCFRRESRRLSTNVYSGDFERGFCNYSDALIIGECSEFYKKCLSDDQFQFYQALMYHTFDMPVMKNLAKSKGTSFMSCEGQREHAKPAHETISGW